MVCHNCKTEMVKAGTYGRKRIQRFKCKQCRRRFAEPRQKPFGADVRLPEEKVRMILLCLVEATACVLRAVCATWSRRRCSTS